MRLYWEAFLRLIYPAYCGACETILEIHETGLCSACQKKLDELCYSPEDTEVTETFECLGKAWALYPYEAPARDVLAEVKFKRKRWLLKTFDHGIRLAAETIKMNDCYDALVPIPLDRRKLMDREFNQSELLAERISVLTGIRTEKSLLKKRWATATQSTLHRDERLLNLRGAFKTGSRHKITGKKFLLVDDIFTTGATAEEAARELKQNGANQVDILAIARTEVKS